MMGIRQSRRRVPSWRNDMGIEFSFIAKPAVHESVFSFGEDKQKSNREQLLRALEKVMDAYECYGEVYPEDGCFSVHFCPQG